MSQDDELALMVGYAAAMDASMSEGSSTQDVTTAIASGTSTVPDTSEPQEGPSGIGRPPEDWESQTGEELDHTSLSMCVSEVNCKKSRGERSQRELTDHPKPCATVDGHDGTAGVYRIIILHSKSNLTLNPLKPLVSMWLFLWPCVSPQ